MARPRIHDIDELLDSAEQLLADNGSSGVTIRALQQATGASSGTLYHAFGSRNELLGRMWLRAAGRFLDLQEDALTSELEPDQGRDAAIRATVAVASVPARIQASSPATAKVLMRHRRDEILSEDLPPELRRDLEQLDVRLLHVLRRLADALWERHDRSSVETVAICVVDLPTALLINRRDRSVDPLAALEAAVRGVLQAHPLPSE